MSITSAKAAKSGLEAALKLSHSLAAAPIKRKIKNWYAEERIEKLYRNLKDVRKVKTIWSMDKAIDLSRFYYPTTVTLLEEVGDEELRVERVIKRIADMGHQNRIVEGTVGQGKSIFFRFLASQEMAIGARVPVFIELRRVEKANLLGRVSKVVSDLGITSNQEVLNHLLRTGSVVLVLDGFDEVKDVYKRQLIDAIENIVESYPGTQILVSTRPGSLASTMTSFVVSSIVQYGLSEVPKVIERFAPSREVARDLVKEISTTKSNMPSLLKTPLMVALLIFKYSKTNLFPDTAAEFYDDLFEILYITHDQSKLGGVDRDKRCPLREVVMRSVFDTFSFLTRYDDLVEIDRRDARKLCQKALEKQAAKAEPSDYLHDIEKITCLIQREGSSYKYVHKSVQEYHSACYIRELDDRDALKFYSMMHKKHHRWSVELSFLESIDERRYYANFGLQQLEDLFGHPRSIPEKFVIDERFIQEHASCFIRLHHIDDKKRFDGDSGIFIYITSDLYYFGGSRSHLVHKDIFDVWKVICALGEGDPYRRKQFRPNEITSNPLLLEWVVDFCSRPGYGMYHKSYFMNDLPAKLARARDLSKTKSISKTNPYV